MPTILLLEDDETISFGIKTALTRKGFGVVCCACVAEAEHALGGSVLHRTPVSFAALLADAAEPMEQVLRSRCQQLELHGGGVMLTCDIGWTAEALLNLIKNGSEHTPRHGTLRAEATENPLYCQIVLEDSGSGFDPDEIPRLFRRFYRGKNSAKDSIGIGLALAKSIIKQQDGVIRAENRHEGGARFIVRLYH